MRYNVLTAESLQGLVDKVEDALNKDWSPEGGISVLSTTTGTVYIQAIVLHEGAYDY